ncbi:hypothetical protein NXV57_27410 [Bacteroides thetaiotaomicron]|nr:hypothetical protein [Bacteroides thetaiotaomicron]
MSVSEIREKAGAKYDESLRDQSKERVSALFDKERANDPKYVAEPGEGWHQHQAVGEPEGT